MAGLRTSWHVNRLHSRARALLTQGKAAEAEPLCQEAVALAPQSAKAWLFLSWAYLDLDQLAEALAACDHALSIDPHRHWAWKNKGVTLNLLKRHEDALEALAHVPLHSSFAQSANWERAVALRKLGQFDALQREAERLIKYNPNEPRHWRLLGEALDSLKRYDEALSAYARSIKLDPQYAGGWVGRAYTLYHLKRYAEALEVCERVFAMEPKNSSAWQVKIFCLLGERRYEEAIAACDYALTLPNASAVEYVNKGVVLLRVGRYTDAASALTHALAIEPDNSLYLNNLGCVYACLQYDERALSIFERACVLDERVFYAWMSAAETLISLGRYDEAHGALTRAKELRNTSGLFVSSATFPAWLGILHTRQGHYDEAMAAFKEALAADPDNSEACMGFAELLLALGESEKAKGMIERSLTLDPFDARVWSLKARILRAAGDEGGADEAEAHGQRMLAEQRAQFAAWEREQAGA